MPNHVMLLVGTTKGAFFFHSDAERREWRMTGPHLPGWEIYSLLGDLRHGQRIYAGTSHYVYGPTVRVSDDLGETWTELAESPKYAQDTGFKLERIWQITPGHASQPDTLYAGVQEAGLFVSHDRGETWAELSGLTQHPTRPNWFPGAGGMCLHTILVDPANPQRMWIAISAVGVFRTEDGGENWKVCNNGLPSVPTGVPDNGIGRCIHKVVLDPQNSDTLYMQFHGGVFKSTDGADSWTPIEQGLPDNFGFPICISNSGALYLIPLASNEQRVVKDGSLRVYRSDDRGASWASVGTGLPEQPEYVSVLRDAMAVDPLEPAGVYFGTTMGEVFCSPDAGETWARLPGQFPRITTVKTWILD
ncbi:MAG TPA: hypothetical protein VFG50_07050 [Rhodothermales bacterium]|nr:hypothetical protein [Rhodothermales bacterium]